MRDDTTPGDATADATTAEQPTSHAMTPGDWHHTKGSSPHYQGHISSDSTGQTIAVAYNDETGANGIAIAAVPELIAALQMWVDWRNGGDKIRSVVEIDKAVCAALKLAGVQS